MTKMSVNRGLPKFARCSPWDTDSGRDLQPEYMLGMSVAFTSVGRREREEAGEDRETTSLDLMGKSRAGIIFRLVSTRWTVESCGESCVEPHLMVLAPALHDPESEPSL